MIFVITIFLIGFVGSFISGMVGIGGAIVNFPMLLYIPAALGIASFSAYEVSGITAIQVLFATIGGVFAYRKGGFLNKTIIGYMGISILVGSLAGGFISSSMSEAGINIIYGILALTAVVMMFLPKKESEKATFDKADFNQWLAAIIALIVGIAAGIVGAGGAFLLVPIMLTVLKIPTRITIASSLAITFISSIGSATSKILTDQVLVIPAIIVIVASLLASPLGAKVGKKLNTKYLQWILAILILGTAIKIWIDIFI
ncbi:sulfite exporter TauE/SafE family protein [Lentibacillus sp. Marseille-P4043]|uniref:sulfite exporter TauE/SafE family protein n=1 Tax=Lentibacillus sp. Marseille-P4043 TaxID=2040293 RepID=UPI003FA3CF12